MERSEEGWYALTVGSGVLESGLDVVSGDVESGCGGGLVGLVGS